MGRAGSRRPSQHRQTVEYWVVGDGLITSLGGGEQLWSPKWRRSLPCLKKTERRQTYGRGCQTWGSQIEGNKLNTSLGGPRELLT